jgi:hypothetical protein
MFILGCALYRSLEMCCKSFSISPAEPLASEVLVKGAGQPPSRDPTRLSSLTEATEKDEEDEEDMLFSTTKTVV